MFRASPRLAAYAFPPRVGLAVLILAVLLAARLAPSALGAEPSPILVDPLDPRAEGEGPGLVGAPLLAALAVVALGVIAAAGTALYVRLTRRR